MLSPFHVVRHKQKLAPPCLGVSPGGQSFNCVEWFEVDFVAYKDAHPRRTYNFCYTFCYLFVWFISFVWFCFLVKCGPRSKSECASLLGLKLPRRAAAVPSLVGDRTFNPSIERWVPCHWPFAQISSWARSLNFMSGKSAGSYVWGMALCGYKSLCPSQLVFFVVCWFRTPPPHLAANHRTTQTTPSWATSSDNCNARYSSSNASSTNYNVKVLLAPMTSSVTCQNAKAMTRTCCLIQQ